MATDEWKMGKGWFDDSIEHGLAAIGIKTREKNKLRRFGEQIDFSKTDSKYLELISKDVKALPIVRKKAFNELVSRERKENPWISKKRAERIVREHTN